MKVFQRPQHVLKYLIRYGLAKGDLHSCIRCGQHCMFVLVISPCLEERVTHGCPTLTWTTTLYTKVKRRTQKWELHCWNPKCIGPRSRLKWTLETGVARDKTSDFGSVQNPSELPIHKEEPSSRRVLYMQCCLRFLSGQCVRRSNWLFNGTKHVLNWLVT